MVHEAVWRIELLGGLRAVMVQGETRTVTRFRTQKTAALLAYLALHRERPQPRPIIQDLLWPEEPVEAGQNALRVALNSLRKQLEPPGVPYGGILFADRITIQLNPTACTTDVALFEEMLVARETDRRITLIAALAHDGGELLPGFYEEWVLSERERLNESLVRALLELARLQLNAREYEQAIDSARRATRTDPYSEEACRLLMQAQARSGNPENARREFNRLVHLLRKEMNAVPDPETRTIAAQLEQIAEAAGKHLDTYHAETPSATPLPTLTPLPVSEDGTLSQPPALPFAFTRFFGRETEKARLCALLADGSTLSRQVTLTGAGGSGKTRLAIETARSLAPAYGGAVTFVSLMEERESRRILENIAQALHLPRSVTGEYMDAVVGTLASPATALLVLDGFEQLAAGGGAVVLSLLKAVPTLRILVTSRRRLEIPGEQEFPVTPLPVPGPDDLTVERFSEWPAVQLFIDRAQAAKNDFTLTSRNAPDLAAVVSALEGIPLSIELAAARVRTVSLAQMRTQFTGSDGEPNRFPLLTARRVAGMPDRHHSLWATIAWSFDLLSPALRRFFTQLSVFRGGWTLEAAQAVCCEPFAPEYLTQLRAHSLVMIDERETTEPRFRLLDSLREFAAEHLSDGDQEHLVQRHIAYFGRMADESRAGLRGSLQQEWLGRMDADFDNVDTALERCAASASTEASAETALLFAGNLAQYWQMHGPLRPSADFVSKLLARTEKFPSTSARAGACNTVGGLYLRLGDYGLARRYLDASLVIYRHLQEEIGIRRVLSNLGLVYGRTGDLVADRAAQTESLEIALRLGDRWGIAAAALNLGTAARDMGDNDVARTAFAQSLEVSREIEDARGIAVATLNLANLAYANGDFEQACTGFEECLMMARAQNNTNLLAIALSNIGNLCLEQNDLESAERYLKEALEVCRTTGDGALAGAMLIDLGKVALAQGQYDRAEQWFQESLSLPLTHHKVCISLEAFADLAFARNEGERAVLLSGAIDALRTASQNPRSKAQQTAHDLLMNDLRAQIGTKRFDSYWGRGEQMSQEQACDLARQAFSSVRKKRKSGAK